MPTARGWLVAFSGLVAWVVGRGFGAGPVEQIGIALVVLVAIASAVVRLGRYELTLTRRLQPARCRAGQKVTVAIEVFNAGAGPAPLVLLEDALPAVLSTRARFALHGIETQGKRAVAYDVVPSRRGRYALGPTEVIYLDPFGLARVVRPSAARSDLLVHPRVEELSLPRDFGRQRSLVVSALRSPSGPRGEDFYTLREYAEGDDLRKVHWPSTARLGKYMIRQEETSWRTRSTILVDDRSEAHEGLGESSSFERAVEAAASLAALYQRASFTYRLLSANHDGLLPGRGSRHFTQCLDLLATLEPKPGPAPGEDPLAVRLAQLQSGTVAEGTLVAVLGGSVSAGVATGLGLCGRRFSQVIAIIYPSHRFGGGDTRDRWDGERRTMEVVRLLTRTGVGTVVLGPGDRLGAGWDVLSGGARRGGERTWAPKPELA